MTSADCSVGVSAACACAQSIAVARHFPGRDEALPGYEREGSLHKRAIYPLPWFTGLCCVVPAPPQDASLLWRSCSSPRSAVAGFLQTSPHGAALALDSELASGILRLMKVNLLQGTSTPTLTPMPGVHHLLHRIAARLRFRVNLKGHRLGGKR